MFKEIVYVDMDDTICKYTEHHAAEYSRTNLKYPQSQKGFYLKIVPISGAIEAVNKLNEIFDVWFLTRPSYKNAHCYTEKRLWIEEHFGLEWCNKLILHPDKSLAIGHYLVDDHPWPGFKGEQLLFGSKKYPNWNKVYNTLLRRYNNSTSEDMGPIDMGEVDDY